MQGFRFTDKWGSLNTSETNKWLSDLPKSLKAAAEFEVEFEKDGSVYEVEHILNPTQSFDEMGTYGVFDVKEDGSLHNGVEITTVARKIDFNILQNQFKGILARVNEHYPIWVADSCGGHFHILSTYRGYDEYGHRYKELFEPVPGIIAQNYWQLIRKYLPALFWMSSVIYTKTWPDFILRYHRGQAFCRTDYLMKYSGAKNSCSSLFNKVYDNRYSALNYANMSLRDEDVSIFHIEHRYPDGNLSPSAVAAMCCLGGAMVIKAIKLSRWGILMCSNEEIATNRELLSNLNENNNDTLRKMALELVKFVSPEIKYFDQEGQALKVLNKLAHKPIALMMYEADNKITWEQIEDNLIQEEDAHREVVNNVIYIIDTLFCSGKNGVDDWYNSVAKQLSTSANNVKKAVETIGATFDDSIGSFIRSA